ncbi:DrmE family protein [Terrisporobacter vanillatitrophus]|uniref:DrmE family protein n=1 Tax=Terrisporobacter vanillatitrophus TaxID=3058402 RepID=UPI003EBB0D7E
MEFIKNISENEEVKFFYKDKTIKLGQYEEEKIKVFEDVTNNKDKLNTMIYVGDYTMNIILLISLAIKSFLKNVTNKDNHVIKQLNIGDKVFVNGKVGEYKGISDMETYGKGMQIEFNDRSKSTILEDFSYRVLIYNGDAQLSKMTTRMSTKEFITKDIISTLLYEENSKDKIKEFVGTIIQSNIIVIPNKEFLENILKEITIEFNDKRYSFTEIFPCSYITSGQNIITLQGNYAKQEPLLYFTTSISIAYEFVRVNKNIEKVFILDGKQIEKEYSDMENIVSRKSVKQVNIICDNTNILYLSNLIQQKDIKNNNNNIYFWSENVLLNLPLQDYFNDNNEFLINQKERVNNYLEKMYEIEEISNENISNLITETKICLSKILKSDLEEVYKNIFLINGFGLINTLETTPFPIELLEQNAEKLGIRLTLPNVCLENLKNITNEIFADHNIERYIDMVIDNIDIIIKNMYKKNYKWDRLLGIMNKYRYSKYYKKNNNNIGNAVVIVKKQYEAIILERYFKDCGINVDVVSIDKYNINNSYSEVYILGYYNFYKKDIINDNNLINVKFLVYKSELKKIKKIIHKINYLKKILEENNKIYNLLDMECFENINNDVLNEVSVDEDNIVENDLRDIKELEEYIEYNRFNIDFHKISYSNQSDVRSMVNIEKIVVSDDNEYALLTKQYNANAIDLEEKKIRKKKVKDIKEGDMLLFLNEYLDEESHIVINIIEELIRNGYLETILQSDDSKSIKEKYELTKYWKSKLDSYREDNQLTYIELSNKFKNFDEKVHHVTIANWINNRRIIGPRDKSMYIAISKLINDDYMKNNIDEIYKASKDIRRLHTKIKNNMDKIIVSNYFDNKIKVKDPITKVIADTIGDTNQYISTIQVGKVIESNKEVPAYISNKLLDIENIY